MEHSRRSLLSLAAVLAFAGPAGADETVFCDRVIRTLPYQINTPGRYCFGRNLSTSMTAGTAAILIASDDVTLDLNRFRLDGSAAGAATQAIGIHSDGRAGVTVRNGTVSGFQRGIYLIAPGTRNTLVERIRAENNTAFGIQVFGDSSIVRDNVVTDTGGSTSMPAFAFGINTAGNDVQVLNNSVVNTFASAPGGFASGIQSDQSDATLFDNRIFRVTGGGANYGIFCNGGGVTPLIRDNAVIGATVPYFGCTPVGTTNHP
jgi:hypothetical protein